jgi:ferredoxin
VGAGVRELKMADIFAVTFRTEGMKDTVVQVPQGTSLLDAASRAALAIDAPCAGNGTCGKCRVKIAQGTVESEPTRHIGDDEYGEGWRLACSSRVRGPVTVQVLETAFAYKSKIRVVSKDQRRETEAFADMKREMHELGVDTGCGIELMRVILKEPDLADAQADRERLLRQIGVQLLGQGRPDLVDISLSAMRKLPSVLRGSGFAVYCVLRHKIPTLTAAAPIGGFIGHGALSNRRDGLFGRESQRPDAAANAVLTVLDVFPARSPLGPASGFHAQALAPHSPSSRRKYEYAKI